ncbi:MAG: hypothetical protein KAS32_16360 [Candidatus Peribacteraceae bacterium]|nr:hypothetical protein [Candidatus Peribacteraceae bacterium]
MEERIKNLVLRKEEILRLIIEADELRNRLYKFQKESREVMPSGFNIADRDCDIATSRMHTVKEQLTISLGNNELGIDIAKRELKK